MKKPIDHLNSARGLASAEKSGQFSTQCGGDGKSAHTRAVIRRRSICSGAQTLINQTVTTNTSTREDLVSNCISNDSARPNTKLYGRSSCNTQGATPTISSFYRAGPLSTPSKISKIYRKNSLIVPSQHRQHHTSQHNVVCNLSSHGPSIQNCSKTNMDK
ncbi:hypothetical protein Nepgr_027088 [Nepenthes gracilis]|uniref:Uncharacterized protein n=1 Tax=Nepenthes gracilis TaxID=150966 RepID=A0AAD3Y2M3_NEPGR|nr:hypothetical protein Nepgr_027088 [Nepenthes gracilis]